MCIFTYLPPSLLSENDRIKQDFFPVSFEVDELEIWHNSKQQNVPYQQYLFQNLPFEM